MISNDTTYHIGQTGDCMMGIELLTSAFEEIRHLVLRELQI
tara:strand:+ start:410 stop:532 length:123 start_codon:yes stop_codon:yes gene_type:complete